MAVSENFPVLKNDNLLRAARGDNVDRIPVWVMRQAGRYLPEFQEVRKQHDFFEICKTPALACEVTLQPIRRFDLDGSIIFCDILVIPQAIGMHVEMRPGPIFTDPLQTPDDLEKLTFEGAIEKLKYVGEAIKLTRHTLDGKVPLFGFTGAPWTLMVYMIESGVIPAKGRAKQWLKDYPEASHQLLSKLTDAIVDYLEMQVKYGAQILQVFESSADCIDKEQFAEVSLPYVRQIRERLLQRLSQQSVDAVPMVLFAKGAGHSLREQAECGYEVISLDYNVDPIEARQAVGQNTTLQGNLDPASMYKPADELKELIKKMVQSFGKKRYIANLGHGITPQTPIESMSILVDTVHKISAEMN